MKKKLLFILNNLNCGGAEKALISLLETLDYSRFEVDLFLFKHEGLFMKKIPKEVVLLSESKYYRYFDMPIKTALYELIKKRAFSAAYKRCYLGYLVKKGLNGGLIEQIIWKKLSPLIEKPKKTYDVAIGFLEKNPTYFCVDNVKATKKIGWIHTDYNKLEIMKEFDKNYFKKLDYVVTVSDDLVGILQGVFPEFFNKIKSVRNIISPTVIHKLSMEKTNIRMENNTISLISVGRLVKEKGLEFSLDAFEILIKRGLNIHWYLVGEGGMRSFLEKEIKERDLEKNISLLGSKDNPYPYIKNADIYIQTSRVEGKSISIMEAKILKKPILITNFYTAKDHIDHNRNGIIAEMNAKSIADLLEILIKNKDLRKKLSDNLADEDYGTENEIEKFYELIV